MKSNEVKLLEKYFDVLGRVALFRGLTKSEIAAVLRDVRAHVISKEAGEYIFHAGDTTACMGIVLSGGVTVVQDDLWGRRNIITRIGAGDIFAEIFASVPGAVLNVSVLADEASEVMLLNTSRLMNASPDAARERITRNLVAILARKTLVFNDKVTHISKRTTREKLLSFLSSESLRQGKLSFDIAYDRQQLADYLCVDRAAMSVELSKLQKDGVLKYNKNHFELMEAEEG